MAVACASAMLGGHHREKHDSTDALSYPEMPLVSMLGYDALTARQTAGSPPDASNDAADGDGLRRIGAPHWMCG